MNQILELQGIAADDSQGDDHAELLSGTIHSTFSGACTSSILLNN
ncbi:hypothetical protein [Actinoplanes sp. NBRC 103695]|nr:hypothetical protein [Actinoplanes sp. NBRC 103695]GLY98695.1 hypothetical protein Acsp02_59490 [Actinoplanes sp. NBRC 103695]